MNPISSKSEDVTWNCRLAYHEHLLILCVACIQEQSSPENVIFTKLND